MKGLYQNVNIVSLYSRAPVFRHCALLLLSGRMKCLSENSQTNISINHRLSGLQGTLRILQSNVTQHFCNQLSSNSLTIQNATHAMKKQSLALF